MRRLAHLVVVGLMAASMIFLAAGASATVLNSTSLAMGGEVPDATKPLPDAPPTLDLPDFSSMNGNPESLELLPVVTPLRPGDHLTPLSNEINTCVPRVPEPATLLLLGGGLIGGMVARRRRP